MDMLASVLSSGFQVVFWFSFVWIFSAFFLKLTIASFQFVAPNIWLRFAARRFAYKDYYKKGDDRYIAAAADELSRIFKNISKKEERILTILEIGCGGGVNFESFPPSSNLLMLDVNPFSKQHMLHNLKNFPHLRLQKFICTSAECMSEVETGSIDVVISSRTLCSVDETKTLKEIHRVLNKRGRFVFEEHVVSQTVAWRLVQQFLALMRVTQMVCFGCRLDKDIVRAISQAGFHRINFKQVKPTLFHHLQPHIVGSATKQHGRV